MRSIRAALFLACSVALVAAHAHTSFAGGKPSHGGQGIQLTSDAVVPGPGDPSMDGTAIVNVGHGEVCYVVTIATVASPITEIALYQGAAGQVGTKVLRLTPSPIGIYQMQACAPCSDGLCRDISRNPSNYYIQVTTQTYSNGAVRGQLH